MKCPNCLRNIPTGTDICPICAYKLSQTPKAKNTPKMQGSSSMSFGHTPDTASHASLIDSPKPADTTSSDQDVPVVTSPSIRNDMASMNTDAQENDTVSSCNEDNTDDTAYDQMSLVSLKTLCADRFIPISAKINKSDAIELLEAYDSLYEEYNDYSLQELKDRCDAYELDYMPREEKNDLIAKIIGYIMNNDQNDYDADLDEIDIPEDTPDDRLDDNEFKNDAPTTKDTNVEEKDEDEPDDDHLSFAEMNASAKFDPNSDGYYNDVLPEIMDKVDRISSENILRAVAIGIGFIVIVFILIFFV